MNLFEFQTQSVQARLRWQPSINEFIRIIIYMIALLFDGSQNFKLPDAMLVNFRSKANRNRQRVTDNSIAHSNDTNTQRQYQMRIIINNQSARLGSACFGLVKCKFIAN